MKMMQPLFLNTCSAVEDRSSHLVTFTKKFMKFYDKKELFVLEMRFKQGLADLDKLFGHFSIMASFQIS